MKVCKRCKKTFQYVLTYKAHLCIKPTIPATRERSNEMSNADLAKLIKRRLNSELAKNFSDNWNSINDAIPKDADEKTLDATSGTFNDLLELQSRLKRQISRVCFLIKDCDKQIIESKE